MRAWTIAALAALLFTAGCLTVEKYPTPQRCPEHRLEQIGEGLPHGIGNPEVEFKGGK